MAPDVYFVILESYPYIRILEFGHSRGSNSAGQNRASITFSVLSASLMLCRDAGSGDVVDDDLPRRARARRMRFSLPPLSVFKDAFPAAAGDEGLRFSVDLVHDLYGWPWSPCTKTKLCNEGQ